MDPLPRYYIIGHRMFDRKDPDHPRGYGWIAEFISKDRAQQVADILNKHMDILNNLQKVYPISYAKGNDHG